MGTNFYELTNPQKSIWLTEQFYKGSCVNNILGSMIINEKINFDILKKAIYKFVEDNDAFRLKFFHDGKEIKQQVLDNINFDVPIIKFSSDDDLLAFEQKVVNTPFDIFSSLFNFYMFDLPNNRSGFMTSMHHLISDACTSNLIANKVINIYTSLIKNEEISEVPTSYINYINSENEYLSSSKFEKDKEYWNTVFDTIPEIGFIPSIKKENKNNLHAERKTFIISKDQLENINNFCSKNKISAFNFFMALYSVYISKVSGLDDFVLGTPILNRSTFVEKNTPGMFISTVPFRFTIKDKLSFIDFAKKIGSDSLGMFRHQKYPYQNILEDIRKKNPSQPNLYDILISYQNTKTNRNSSEVPYEVRWTFNNTVADSMQIHLFDMNDFGLLNISYDYRLDKYSEENICDIHNRISYMIEQVLASNSLLIDDIEIVTPKEKDIIFNKFNNTSESFSFENSIIEMIEKVAKEQPNNIAIETDNSTITYEALIKRVNQLSNYLLNNDIHENSNIGIFSTRTIDTIIGILSILKINCTYVPIDPEYPIDRISYMINTSKINYILSEDISLFDKIANIENLEKISINFLNYKSENSIFNKTYNYDNNSNLYIIFTSGSTGRPKGVTISHKNIINLILFEKSHTNLIENTNNKILQFATMSFDVSYQEIYSALLFGNTLVLIDEVSRKDMNKLSKYIFDKGVNTLFISPAYLKLLVEDKDIRKLLIACVKNIITAGEALTITDGMRELIEYGIQIHNHYGPAETHVATTYTINTNNICTYPPIGKPISNSNIHILDKKLKLCPIGVMGQICISGNCVGNGYFNNDILTNEKFIINSYNDNKMYLTGDLGFFDESGNIHFVGRSDFQVKLNGFRVELEEIDQVLLKHPDVKSCVSIIHEENNKKYIIVYYVEENSTKEVDLIKYLKTALPFYMIPKKLIKIDTMPININGKIDKNRLPKFKLVDIEDEFIEPTTSTELRLAEIWKNLFDTDKISANYNFFDIGGDSLLAIKLSSIILSSFNVTITVGEIFSTPTIYELSNLIDKKQQVENKIISPCKKKEFYHLSSAQKRIYYSSKMSGENSTLYNMPGAIVFDKKPDIEKLNACFKKLIERHSSLRTYFEIVDGEVHQKISNNISFEIKEYWEKDKTIDEIIKDFVKPFDLEKAALFRVSLVNSKDKVLLLFDMHHIISDGLSLSILTTELCNLYNGEELSEKQLQYIDYAEWEYKNLKENIMLESREYWVNQFKDDIPVLNMPTDYTRPAIQSFEGAKVYKTIPTTLTNKINSLAKKLDVSNYMLLLACYYILLSKYTNQEDIVVGTPVANRNKEELLNMIGMFVNSLPLKNHVESSMSFYELLNNIKTNSINALSHQFYPFDELVNDLNITRDSSRNPLFDTMFIYQNNGIAPIHFNEINSKYYIPDTKISKFDLSLEVIPTENEFELNFEYCTKLFDKNTIERFSTHFINILEKIVDNYELKIADIDILSDNEKNKILYKFNNTDMTYNKKLTIYQMIEEQCKKTPDAIAVTFEDSSITYRDLNEKSNQLARYMQNLGIGRNSIVGVMLPRSLEVLISIFAVLKTGACYIPIDPTFPKNRIDYMLENSNANLVLCFDSEHEFKNILNVKLDNNDVYSGDCTNLDIVNLGTDPSYIIYTSGSTGNPKGVMLNHMALTNLTNSLNNSVEFLKNCYGNIAMASITTISFDIFIFETLICLQKGLKIVMANKDEQVTAKLLDALIEKHDVKAIQMTPSRMQIFIDNKEQMPHLNNLKFITLAGEALPDKLLAQILEVGNITVYNGYGPSETTVFSTFTDVTNYSKVNIGIPIANTQIYILDKDLNVCPIGVPGEIYIAGDGVGIGYVNNEDITKERFLVNKFDITSRYYRTGDLAKYLPNGEIAYIGRIDNQIKIRGLRIELDEIEKWILKFPNIDKAIVTAKKDEQNRIFLIAYLVVTNRVPITNLRAYLGNNLPRYMVPSYFVILDNFPYLPNGKINKKALPLPNLSTFNVDKKYYAPRSELEIKIANAFQKVLGISPISIKDNFFELGGDSLLAMSLQIELMKISNTITYSDIFMYTTVEELANKIDKYLLSTYSEFYKDDFSNISNILEHTIEKPSNHKKIDIGNILITGATGFLGAHILDEYLKSYPENKAYCLVRSEIGLTLENKLLDKLHFYFGNKYDKLIGDRIIIVNGDISQSNFGLSESTLEELSKNISTLINSAAKVSHYGDYSSFKNINVNGTQNAIDFCKRFNKKLYQISTLSVSGNAFATGSYIEQNFENDVIFKENNFFINQNLNNVYVRSKFEAEKLILESINNGVDAYILRIGNLMARFSDSKFQKNVKENAYVNRLLTFIKIKIVPNYLLQGYAEFTPVDSCAQSILKIMEYPSNNNRIFHLFNHNHVNVTCLLDIFNMFSNMNVLTSDEFAKQIDKLLSLPNSNELLAGILSDFDTTKKLIYESNIKLNSDFTIDYLKNTGFEWPNITNEYLIRFLNTLTKED